MVLTESITNTLESGFIVESPKTGMTIQKIENNYIVRDGKEMSTHNRDGILYFIKCHILSFRNEEDKD